jgi:cell division transport system ATP-binding protein
LNCYLKNIYDILIVGGIMVNLVGVSKWYAGETHVLDHVTLTLKKGEFLYVVGGTGAGKSSLLRMLATQEQPSRGDLSLFGYNLNEIGTSSLRAIRRSLGYIPQDVKLVPDLTVFENVALSLTLAGKRMLSVSNRNKIHELLSRLGLETKRDKLATTLSGGEAQRVAAARALVRNPELIVADEPTGSQDRDFKWSLMDLFLKANQAGATVVLATHDREVVRRVRKRCAILRGGKVELEESPCSY